MALGAYEGALRSAVHALKFRNARQVAALLGARLGAKYDGRFDVVIPVPLHPSRLRARGFNQSELIARAILSVALERSSMTQPIADRLPIIAPQAIVRVRATQSQSKLDLMDRDANVAGAFAPGSGAAAVRGKHVLLVDDVVTTGATIRACAAILRKCEAATVTAAALALRL